MTEHAGPEHDVATMATAALRATKGVDQLKRIVRRQRVGMVVVIALTIAQFVGLQEHSSEIAATSRLAGSTAQVVAAQRLEVYNRCVQGNDFRNGDKRLWDYLLGLANQGPEPPGSRLVEQKFRRILNRTERLQQCGKP